MKHSPQIELMAAKRQLEAARETCAHWDYECDSECDYECCRALDYARVRVKRAREAAARKVAQ